MCEPGYGRLSVRFENSKQNADKICKPVRAGRQSYKANESRTRSKSLSSPHVVQFVGSDSSPRPRSVSMGSQVMELNRSTVRPVGRVQVPSLQQAAFRKKSLKSIKSKVRDQR